MLKIQALTSRPKRPSLAAALCFDNAPLNSLPYSSAEAAAAAKADGFKGQKDKSFYLPQAAGRGAGRLLFVGLGEAKAADLDTFRRAAVQAARKAREAKAGELVIALPEGGLKGATSAELAGAVAEGVWLGLYKFTEGKGVPKEPSKEAPAPASVGILGGGARAAEALKQAAIVCEAVNLVRDWVNRPAGDKRPADLAAAVRRAAQGVPRLTVKVLNKAAIQRAKMAGLLAVNQGSHHPPVFVHLHYKPARARKRVALVGKGVTFDSGGLNIKTGNFMLDMKSDMAGAAAVLGTAIAAARLRLPVEVHACAPMTENLTGGKALMVGDVVRYSNGKTAEILNTDAEGRILLADGLLYACKLKPDVLLDVATLTGAAMSALGMDITALCGDHALAEKFKQLGAKSGEWMWELPMPERYRSHIDSKLADIKNLGNSGEAGTIAGAMYLKEFVTVSPWLHFDIAGPSFLKAENGVHPVGATGTPLRTLIDYLRTL